MKLGRRTLGALLLGTIACSGGGTDGNPDGQAAGGASQTVTGGTVGTVASGGTPGATLDAPVISPGDGGVVDGASPSVDAQNTVDAAIASLPPWRGGTRLKAQVLRGKDNGPAVFRSTFDSELAVTCSFQLATDGQTRCLPSQVVPYYGDAGCTQLVLPLYEGCSVPSYVSRGAEGCMLQGLAVGAKVTPPKVFFGTPGSCKEVSTTPNQVFYALTVAAPDRFVTGGKVSDPRGGNLEMLYWQSADGGLFPIAAQNKMRQHACKPGEGSAAGRCVPSAVAAYVRNPLTFADAACTVPAAQAYVSTCNPTVVSAIVTQVAGTCESGPTMSYTEAVPGPVVPFRKSGNNCFAAPGTESKVFTAGADILVATLPELSPLLEGGGRLQIRRHRSSEGLVLDAQPGFYDAVAKRDCLPEPTPSGWRCMPLPSYGISVYSDAACTQPAHFEAKAPPVGACGATVPYILYRDAPGAACGSPTYEMFAVGGLITPSKLYRKDDLGCTDSGVDPAVHNVYGTVPATEVHTVALEERNE
jgi:hypothetical protein